MGFDRIFNLFNIFQVKVHCSGSPIASQTFASPFSIQNSSWVKESFTAFSKPDLINTTHTHAGVFCWSPCPFSANLISTTLSFAPLCRQSSLQTSYTCKPSQCLIHTSRYHQNKKTFESLIQQLSFRLNSWRVFFCLIFLPSNHNPTSHSHGWIQRREVVSQSDYAKNSFMISL